jgi:phosphate/sulfate permease
MSASSRSIVSSLSLFSILAFVYSGLCLYTARRDIALAPNESTTTGQAQVRRQSKNRNPFDYLRCDYTFMVNGSFYRGYGICPNQSDPSVKGALENFAGLLQNQRVTVYYDPADPTLNSMMEFDVESAYDYKKAKLYSIVGVVLLVIAVGASFFVSANNASQGIVVDSEGTVIYPDTTDSKQQE